MTPAEELIAPRLRVRTVGIEDPGSLLALLPPKDAYAWVRHGDGMVGWGEVARHKPSSLDEATEWLDDLVAHLEITAELEKAPAGAGFMAFGSFTFDPSVTAAQSTLVVPRVVVGRRNGRSWMTTIGPATPSSEIPIKASNRRRQAISPRAAAKINNTTPMLLIKIGLS